MHMQCTFAGKDHANTARLYDEYNDSVYPIRNHIVWNYEIFDAIDRSR